MIKFKFTVTCLATGRQHVEYEEFASHFDANTYGMTQKAGAKAANVVVTWCAL